MAETRNFRTQLKDEYLRGVRETERTQKKAIETFLGIITERITHIIEEAEPLSIPTDVEHGLDGILDLISEYTDGQTPATDILSRESRIQPEETSSFPHIEGDEVISLMDLARMNDEEE